MHNSQLISPQQIMIECILDANGLSTSATNPFTQQEYLVDRPIIALQVFSASDMPFSPLASKLPVIPDALFPYGFLNIQRSGMGPTKAGQWYKYLPLCSLRTQWNNAINLSGTLDKFWVDPMTMQWPDSNIAFPTPQPQDERYSLPMLVTFLLKEQDPTAYRRAFLKR